MADCEHKGISLKNIKLFFHKMGVIAWTANLKWTQPISKIPKHHKDCQLFYLPTTKFRNNFFFKTKITAHFISVSPAYRSDIVQISFLQKNQEKLNIFYVRKRIFSQILDIFCERISRYCRIWQATSLICKLKQKYLLSYI